MITEESVGAQPKKAAVLIGRFQPPTASHFKMVDLVRKFIRLNKDVTPFIVVVEGKETSKDLKKNPLSGDDRQKILQASGKTNGIKILKASSLFDGFEAIRNLGYEPYAICAGSDRAKDYIKILDDRFTDGDKKLKHVLIPGLDDRDDPDDGAESAEILKMAEAGEDIPFFMISGSMARLAVDLGYKNAFQKITSLDKKLSDIVFLKIQNARKEVKE